MLLYWNLLGCRVISAFQRDPLHPALIEHFIEKRAEQFSNIIALPIQALALDHVSHTWAPGSVIAIRHFQRLVFYTFNANNPTIGFFDAQIFKERGTTFNALNVAIFV